MNNVKKFSIFITMIKFNLRSSISNLLFDIKDHFRIYKKFYFIFFTLVLIGLITGMLTAFKYSGEIELSNLNDKILISFISNDIGAFVLLLRRLFAFCILFFILFLINIKPLTCFLNFALILYESYTLGLNCAIFITLFNISGVINVFIVYLPCHLLSLIALMALSTIFCSSCFKYRKFGENILCSSFWQQNGRSIVFMLCLALASSVLEAILLPTFCNVFFIIN